MGVSAFIFAFSRVMSLDLILIISKNISRVFAFAGYASLISVSDIFLRYVLSRLLAINSSSTASWIASTVIWGSPFEWDMICDLANQLHIFSLSVCNMALRIAVTIFSSLKPTIRPSRLTTVCIMMSINLWLIMRAKVSYYSIWFSFGKTFAD